MEKIALDEAAKIELRIDSIDPIDDIGRLRLAVKVRNLSRTVLDSEGENPGYLVYRWIDAASGRLVVAESPVTPLSAPVPGGGEGSFDLLVTPPEEPGRYILRATIVQHLHYWFDHPPVNVFSEVPHEIESWPDEDVPDVPFVGTPWINRARYRSVLAPAGRPRPLALTCETTNVCNNDCIICAYSSQSRPKGVMSLEVFEKVLSDYSELGGGLLSLTPVVGDVFLDAKLADRLRLAESYPLVNDLSVTTNAIAAKRYEDDELDYVLNRFRQIQISIYGLDEEEYVAMTQKNTYGQMLSSIDRILGLFRGRLVLVSQLLKKRSLDEVRRWAAASFANLPRTAAQVTIQEPYNDFSNWGILDTGKALPFDATWRANPGAKKQCLTPLVSFQVFWNGNVSFCPCDDFDNSPDLHLGNVMQQSLAEMYSSEKVRRLWSWPVHGVPEFCKSCSFYQPMETLLAVPGALRNPRLLMGS
ncbi:MAG TPA: SPASM domain-containing protein [Thermoanaerobaculia bacterium]|jgi:radical SAM protein with 4Fe4S-binding SPASM domain|nr:SPASM domain-containing protein [Thermoanaerobaculia bacterium]